MSLGAAGKTQISANTTAIADGDSIASYLVDAAGTLLTSTLNGAKQSLDVYAAGTYAEDSAHASGDLGLMSLAVRNDAGTPLAADGDYIPFTTDATGALRVAASFAGTITTNYEYAEDSASASGFIGAAVLGVRRDTTAATAGTTGDYSEFQTWSNGEMKVADIVNLANLQQVIAVGTTAVALPAAALALRKSVMIQMLGDKDLYIGSSTVTSSGATRGFKISKGGFVSVDAGPAQAIFGIASAAAQDVVVWEMS